MESFLLDQLDEALDLIKKEVTLTQGGTYQMSGVGITLKKNQVEEALDIKYVFKARERCPNLSQTVTTNVLQFNISQAFFCCFVLKFSK